jgi:hypothetical protein
VPGEAGRRHLPAAIASAAVPGEAGRRHLPEPASSSLAAMCAQRATMRYGE